MSRFSSLAKLVGSDLNFILRRHKIILRGKRIIKSADAANHFSQIINSKAFKSSSIDWLTTQILYEGLLVSSKLRRDYSDELYRQTELSLSIPADSMTRKVMNHIASEYWKAFNSLDAAFVSENRKIRFIMKSARRRIYYYEISSLGQIAALLPTLMSGKRVMAISDHADLIKVQFVRMKQLNQHKDRYFYSLMAIDDFKVASNTDRSLYFESLDAMEMALLSYTFDILLIHEDIYALPLSRFISKLSLPCLIMDDSIYALFNLARSRTVIGQEKEGTLFLDDYDREENEDFQASTYLSKIPLISKKKR